MTPLSSKGLTYLFLILLERMNYGVKNDNTNARDTGQRTDVFGHPPIRIMIQSSARSAALNK